MRPHERLVLPFLTEEDFRAVDREIEQAMAESRGSRPLIREIVDREARDASPPFDPADAAVADRRVTEDSLGDALAAELDSELSFLDGRGEPGWIEVIDGSRFPVAAAAAEGQGLDVPALAAVAASAVLAALAVAVLGASTAISALPALVLAAYLLPGGSRIPAFALAAGFGGHLAHVMTLAGDAEPASCLVAAALLVAAAWRAAPALKRRAGGGLLIAA